MFTDAKTEGKKRLDLFHAGVATDVVHQVTTIASAQPQGS